MKRFMSVIFAVVALFALALPFAVSAQQPVTINEDSINSTFRLRTMFDRDINNVVVDLQPGQVVVSADVRVENIGRGSTMNATTAVIVPEVRNGRVYWSLESVTANGAEATPQLTRLVNLAITRAWREWTRENSLPRRGVTSVEITDTQIIIS